MRCVSLGERLSDAYVERRAVVTGLRRQTLQQVADWQVTRTASAADQRAALAQGHQALQSEIAVFLGEAQAAMATMAAGQRAALAQGHQALQSETAVFLGEAQAAMATMAAGQRAALAQGHQALQSETAVFLGEAQAAHRRMAAGQKVTLASARAELKRSVAATIAECNAGRRELVASLAESDRQWQEFLQKMQAIRFGPLTLAPAPLEAAVPAVVPGRKRRARRRRRQRWRWRAWGRRASKVTSSRPKTRSSVTWRTVRTGCDSWNSRSTLGSSVSAWRR